MGKLEKIEQLQKLKDNGSLTDEEFKKEKEKLLSDSKEGKNTKLIIVIIVTIAIIIIGIVAFYFINKNNDTNKNDLDISNDGFEQISANVEVNGVSFNNMNSDDENFEKVQQDILEYFDNDYFSFPHTEILQKYPQVFKNAKINMQGYVLKVLKSTDEEFEVLVFDIGRHYAEYYDEDIYQDTELYEDMAFVVKGKQLSQRLTKGTTINIFGRYIDTDTYNIDGKSYILPTFNAINIPEGTMNDDNYRFGFDIVKNVAEYIFGKDIKINEPDEEEINSEYNQSNFYKITLDNQSNANFKVFNMYRNYGKITYNAAYNNLSSTTIKNLFVSADFQHYIVSTYDENTKHVYIDYFDRDLNKKWSREFDYNSTKAFSSPMDYTDKQMAIVVDNDLYLIDLETGENVIEPVIVGEKIKVNMMSDGIILIGDNNKDTIMKVGFNGEILFRTNGKTEINVIEDADTQIVNGKMVIHLYGLYKDEEFPSGYEEEKYIVINSDGSIETSTNDMAMYE